MAASSNFFLKLACVVPLLLVNIAHASPVEDSRVVIPGPGLPSLESLGLTSADLYARTLTELEMRSLMARFPLMCNEVPKCSVGDAVACYNYLNALGHQACTVNGENVTFCTAGGCHWFGSNISGGGSASSYCSDVAIGGNVVINNCQGGGQVSGANAANGNGNLVVTISSES
ncbi:hypothetical protein L218DRAFT_1055494 [Marasmius fiardii PR-910]|nr:hypothetical protein L218DRAFT_1055494 [Marasmius fiardii PR-910]